MQRQSRKTNQTPWDAWAGPGTIQATPHARKMIVTVAGAWSFDRASAKLADICHVKVSDDTIERICQHERQQVRRWQRERDAQRTETFARTPGEVELFSEGLKINPTEGWREARLNLLQKRVPGASVGRSGLPHCCVWTTPTRPPHAGVPKPPNR